MSASLGRTGLGAKPHAREGKFFAQLPYVSLAVEMGGARGQSSPQQLYVEAVSCVCEQREVPENGAVNQRDRESLPRIAVMNK